MKALIVSLLLMGLFQPDVRVVTYSRGKFDTPSYEALTFWIKDNKRAYIRYTKGKEDDIDVVWQEKLLMKGEAAFRIKFPEPDNRNLYVIQNGNGLKVSDLDGKYLKFYSWENEDQLGDSTVKCPICVKDEKEGASLIKKYFMQ